MKIGNSVLAMIVAVSVFLCLTVDSLEASDSSKIVHDAEYYILEAQNAEKWAADDKEVDRKLVKFREKNDGKPPAEYSLYSGR